MKKLKGIAAILSLTLKRILCRHEWTADGSREESDRVFFIAGNPHIFRTYPIVCDKCDKQSSDNGLL